MVETGEFRELIRITLNIEANSALKPTKVSFLFIGPNTLSRVKDLACDTSCRQEFGLRLSLKPGSEPIEIQITR